MKTFDLTLPKWGPYNKFYLGAAHIADPRRGYRFDVNLFPGYYRRSTKIPKDIDDSGAKMMASSVDVSHFQYRYELEWKDRVYIEADFRSSGNTMTIACDFVNNTDAPESLSLSSVFSIQRSSSYRSEIVDLQPVTGEGTRWIDSMDYCRIDTEQQFAQDGLLLGEERVSWFVNGSCISSALLGGSNRLIYRVKPEPVEKLGLRYAGSGRIVLGINEQMRTLDLPDQLEPAIHWLELPAQTVEELTLSFLEGSIRFDGFVLGDAITFDDGTSVLNPEIDGDGSTLLLTFGSMRYQVTCDYDPCFLRRLYTKDVGHLLSNVVNFSERCFGDPSDQPHAELVIRPVFVDPFRRKQVTIRITALDSEDSFPAEHALYEPRCNPAGQAFALSQRIMAAVTLTNVVWPIYNHRGFVRHNTPGRLYDSLYTWDSGFIGMGLAELDPRRGEECLNAYLTEPEDPHSPYIFHGTPLPTQIFLYQALFHKTGDTELLRLYYPMIRRQYRFFADARFNGRAKATGLFSTWDIFYNSGGWDDYPAQEYIHNEALEDRVCPMVNTASTVLFARILKQLAWIIGVDTAEYDEDIAFYSRAVEQYGWDEESGYYGYVLHDPGPELLRINGVNANMGMDGAFPYLAGISSPERAARIIRNIKDGMFTPYGLSIVDTRAPYYRTDGYWNGSVWMPHQWFLWKALLDRGELETAMKIADTALDVWQTEVSRTYNCYEHVVTTNGRGAGFHQFSGLSTPVLMWFNALYRPYTVTSGFLTTIWEQNRQQDTFSFRIRSTAEAPIVLVCLEEGSAFTFQTTGQVQLCREGCWCLCFDGPVEETVTILRL